MKFKTKQEKQAFRIGCIVGRKKKIKSIQKANKKSITVSTKPKRNQIKDDFDYTPNGRIKGSYTSDGFFEPY